MANMIAPTSTIMQVGLKELFPGLKRGVGQQRRIVLTKRRSVMTDSVTSQLEQLRTGARFRHFSPMILMLITAALAGCMMPMEM